MSSFVDYYALLGVVPHATPDEIKAAFRTQARAVHPDLNPAAPNAGARLQALVHARDVLLNTDRRQAYDKTRWAWLFSRPSHAGNSVPRPLPGPSTTRAKAQTTDWAPWLALGAGVLTILAAANSNAWDRDARRYRDARGRFRSSRFG